MQSTRFIVVWVTLSLGFLFTHLAAFGQMLPPEVSAGSAPGFGPEIQPPSGPADVEVMPGTGPHTEMERQEQQLRTPPANWWAPQIQESANPASGPSTVSVAQLQHPLSRKGRRLIQKVESYLRIGQRAKAKQELAQAIKEPSAAPYAHALLGTEYLKEGQPAAAIPELEDAARVLPIAGIHSNLGYALCLTGQAKRGEREFEEALRLDDTSPQAHFLFGVLLLNEKSREQEARHELDLAQNRMRSAHIALAVYHLRRGETEAAQEQVRAYLGPGRDGDFARYWQWACGAAERAHPAAAFGLWDSAADQSGCRVESAGCATNR